MDQVLVIGQLVFAVIGLVAVVGTVVVTMTPGQTDDDWWGKNVLPYIPAIVGGDIADKLKGNGAVPKEWILNKIKEIDSLSDKAFK